MSNIKGKLEQSLRAIPPNLSDEQTVAWFRSMLATIAQEVDAVLSSAGVSSFNTRTGAVTLTSGDVSGASGLLTTGANAGSTAAPTDFGGTFGIKVDAIDSSGTSMISFAKMIGVKEYTSAQEALLVPGSGAVIINTDIVTGGAVRRYTGSAWVTVGGGGLSPTGSDVGATSQAQVFTNGLISNVLQANTGGRTLLKNNAGDAFLKTSVGGFDVEVGDSNAAANGTLLTVSDSAETISLKADNGVLLPDDQIIGAGANAKMAFNQSAQTATITAANGVSTSAGFTVGTDLLTNSIKNNGGNAIVITQTTTNPITINSGTGILELNLPVDGLSMNGGTGYTGTLAQAISDGATIENGIIKNP